MSDQFEIFLTCPKGLEGLLIEEAVGLGLEEAREHTSFLKDIAPLAGRGVVVGVKMNF